MRIPVLQLAGHHRVDGRTADDTNLALLGDPSS